MNKSTVFKKDPEIVTRAIDDELLLLPVYKDAGKDNAIYSLNDAAAAVWKLIDGKRTVDQIAKRLAHDFANDEAVIIQRLEELFGELQQIKAVVAARKGGRR